MCTCDVVSRIYKMLIIAFTSVIYTLLTAAIRLDEPSKSNVYEIELRRSDADFERTTLHRLKEANRMASNLLMLSVGSNEVKLNVNDRNRFWTTYYSNIILGSESQKNVFNVLFDTGSSEFWVPDHSCTSSVCLNRKKLQNNGQWTPKMDMNGNFIPVVIRYLSGEIEAVDGKACWVCMQTDAGTTNVNLMNGIALKDVDVALAKSITAPILNDMPWDGIVGLGLPTAQNQRRQSKTFIETFAEQYRMQTHMNPVFSFYISPRGGNLIFGGYDNKYKFDPLEDFQWSKLVPDSSYWSTKLVKLVTKKLPPNRMYKSKSLAMNAIEHTIFDSLDNDVSVILDSGTFLIYAPWSARDLVESVQVDSCNDVASLPTLHFILDSGTELVLGPDDYILRYKGSDGTDECTCGIVIDSQQEQLGMDAWTLGEVFLRAYYTLYDFGNRRIGFVPAKRDAKRLV